MVLTTWGLNPQTRLKINIRPLPRLSPSSEAHMPTPNSYAVIDFETTGLSSSDRVIEIGLLHFVQHLQIERTSHSFFYPELDILNFFVHNLTNTDVALAPTYPVVGATLKSLLAGSTMVAHIAAFVHRFLGQE